MVFVGLTSRICDNGRAIIISEEVMMKIWILVSVGAGPAVFAFSRGEIAADAATGNAKNLSGSDRE